MEDEILRLEYIQTIKTVQELLRTKTEWINRYKTYAETFSKFQDPISVMKKKINAGSLGIYSSTSRVRKISTIKTEFDLRYRGRSVADLIMKKDNTITLKPKKTNKDIAGYDNLDISEKFPWISKEGTTFRKFFNDKDNAPELVKYREHQYEHKILDNFALKTKLGKIFSGIQPIRLGNCYFQMPTPLKGSDAANNTIEYSNASGGGIDIMARIKGKKLCIIELKDESKKEEDSSQGIKQAIAYATFIHALLRCENAGNKEWWKLFGFNGIIPKQLTIKTVIMMPKGEHSKSFDKMDLNLTDNPQGDKLELNYLFFDPNDFTLDETSL